MYITADYIKSLTNMCWTGAQVDDAVAKEPIPEKATWEWWLGSRLKSKTRREVMDRLASAVLHIKQHSVQVPQGSPSAIWMFATKASDAGLLEYCARLGRDLTDAADRTTQPDEVKP